MVLKEGRVGPAAWGGGDATEVVVSLARSRRSLIKTLCINGRPRGAYGLSTAT